MAAQLERPRRQDQNVDYVPDTQASQTSHQTQRTQRAALVDFNQPHQERLRVRQFYRNLRGDTISKREELLQPNAEARVALREALQQGESSYQNVKLPREGALDAAFLAFGSKLIVEQVERLSSGFRTYNPLTFITRVKEMISSQNRLSEFNSKCSSFVSSTPRANFMIGPLAVDVKVRGPRKERAPADKIEAVVKPHEVVANTEEQNESYKRVMVVDNYLSREEEHNFWKFVFDPDEEQGFGRTIENIFHASFLVRDGTAKMTVRSHQPFISQAVAPSEEDFATGAAVRHQCIVQFDYPMWQSLREKYKDNQPYLPEPEPLHASQTAHGISATPTRNTQETKKQAKLTANAKIAKSSKKRARESEDEIEMSDDSLEASSPKPKKIRTQK